MLHIHYVLDLSSALIAAEMLKSGYAKEVQGREGTVGLGADLIATLPFLLIGGDEALI
jgi:hypothetical protein